MSTFKNEIFKRNALDTSEAGKQMDATPKSILQEYMLSRFGLQQYK